MYSSYLPPLYSGAAKQALSLAKCLRDRGHHVEFITVQWPGLASKDACDGFPVHRVEMGRGKRHKELRLWWNLLRFTLHRFRDFEIFHSHGAYYSNAIVGPLGKLFGWRSLAKASLAENDLKGVKRSLSGCVHYYFLKMVDAYIAISNDLQQEFLSAGMRKDKVHLWANGVDTHRFSPVDPEEKAALRKSLALPVECRIILTVGVFDRRKNIGWLMEEWVRQQGFDNKTYLLAIGPQSREDNNGEFLDELKKMADSHPEMLGLLGHVDNIEQYYRAADLFVLPSTSEGMANVLLEAMASGLPCVATDVSGSKELLRDGVTGFLFKPGDAEGLRRALLRALDLANDNVSRECRKFVENKFSISALACKYEGLYQQLLQKKKKVPLN